MSINSAKVACTGCDYETRDYFRPIRIRYQITNGRTVETGCTKGWCYDCESYSYIESIDQIKLRADLVSEEQKRLEARHHLDELNRGFLSYFRHASEKENLQHECELLDRKIAELGELLEIAKNRKSKARCLKCWSDRTTALSFLSEGNIEHKFQHNCGGNLELIFDEIPDGGDILESMAIRVNYRVSTYVLNEEGEFLCEE